MEIGNETLRTELLDKTEEKPTSKSFILGFEEKEKTDDVEEEGITCSMEISADISEYANSGNYVKIDWFGAIQLWLIALCMLPIYVIAMIVDIHRNCPKLLSKTKSLIIILFSFLILISMWTSVGLWISNQWPIVPRDEIILMILLYIISCGAETVLKSSFYIRQISHHAMASSLYKYKIEDRTAFDVYKKIINMEAPTCLNKILLFVKIVLPVMYELSIELVRWLSPHSMQMVSVSLIVYLILSAFIRISIIYLWLHYLSAAFIQIYIRKMQAQAFTSLTHRSNISNLPYLKLLTKESFSIWLTLRACLLATFHEPKTFVDIILSASVAILIPCILHIFYFIYIGSPFTISFILTSFLAIIIFIYVILCMLLAVISRDKFNETGLLFAAKLRILTSSELLNDRADTLSLVDIIDEILTRSNNDAVIFHIFGLTVNRQITTVIFGLGLSVFWSLILKIFS